MSPSVRCRRIRPASLVAALALLLYPFSAGADGAADMNLLTLTRAVETVRGQNLSIEAEEYSVATSRAAIISERGKFDPVLSFNLFHSTTGHETPSSLDPEHEESIESDLSLELTSKQGTTYELRVGSEWVNSDLAFLLQNPYYRSEVAFTMIKPFLKGFGENASMTGVRVARNSFRISQLKYDEIVDLAVTATIEAYWELYFARANLEVAGQSLDLARNLLEEVRGRIRAGKMASIEVFKAEAEVAQRQETLIRARKAVGDSEDRLREVMNMRDWDREIVPVDEPPPPGDPIPLEEAVEVAFERRRDYRRALLDHENKTWIRKYRENQRKSQLDFVATLSSNSVDDQVRDVPWNAANVDNSSWSAGLTYVKPLGGGEAEGRYMSALHEEGKALVLIEAVAQRVRLDVREAWRNLHVSLESIEATQVTRVAAEKRLLAEEEKFRVGKATLTDVLEFQSEYTKALSAEKRARADYAIAYSGLAMQMGTLLDTIQ